MRRMDKQRLKVEKRREPDEIFTRFVPCSRAGKSGKHAITFTLVGDNTKNADSVVIGITCECEGIDKKELDAIKRLGGETCLTVMEATKERACLGKNEFAKRNEAAIDLGYSFTGRRSTAQGFRAQTAPFKPEVETPSQRWGRLFTMVAQQAAGPGFKALRVNWFDPSTNGGSELTLLFGGTEIASRAGGTWKFDMETVSEDLEHSNGHKAAQAGHFCHVCLKTFANIEAHCRKSRHIEKVVAGLQRAMFRLRKKKTFPVGRHPHPEGGWS